MSDPANRKAVERNEDGTIKAGGGSLNPSGVPKAVLAIRKALEEHGTSAVQKLVQLMDDENARVRLGAVELALAYAIGKPTQAVTVEASAHGTALLALLRSRAEAPKEPDPGPVDP